MLHRLADYSTVVIAAATVAYVVVSILLWRATKASADAAKASADAAKGSADAAKVSADAARKSADIDAALHRPYLGVSIFQRHNDYNADRWAIRWVVKNYGTLAACGVEVEVAVDRDGRGDFAGGPACRGWEMPPQAELEGSLEIQLDRPTRDALSRHEPVVAGHVNITYRSLTGASFSHSADFGYYPTTQNFRPQRSETKGGSQQL